MHAACSTDDTPPTDCVVADCAGDPSGAALPGAQELTDADTGGDGHTRRDLERAQHLAKGKIFGKAREVPGCKQELMHKLHRIK